MQVILLLFHIFALINGAPSANSTGIITGGKLASVELHKSATLSCKVEGQNLSGYKWRKIGDAENSEVLNGVEKNLIDDLHHSTNMTLYFKNVTRENNGTYECQAESNSQIIRSNTDLVVIEDAEIKQFFAEAVMVNLIYVNWTVYNGNHPVDDFTISYRKSGPGGWQYYSEVISSQLSSYFLRFEDLERGADYQFKLFLTNSNGEFTHIYPGLVRALEKDFVPSPSVIEVTNHSITFNWTTPAPAIRDLFNYEIMLIATDNEPVERNFSVVASNNLTINRLEPRTNCRFKVRACIKHKFNSEQQCGDWSNETESSTRNTRSAESLISPSSLSISSSSHPREMYIVSATVFSLYCSMKYS